MPRRQKTTVRTADRAHRLVDLLLHEMYECLRKPERLTTEQWEKLFGTKQSMVANAQKLIAALSDLPAQESEQVQGAGVPLTKQEMELLRKWLKDKDN